MTHRKEAPKARERLPSTLVASGPRPHSQGCGAELQLPA